LEEPVEAAVPSTERPTKWEARWGVMTEYPFTEAKRARRRERERMEVMVGVGVGGY